MISDLRCISLRPIRARPSVEKRVDAGAPSRLEPAQVKLHYPVTVFGDRETAEEGSTRDSSSRGIEKDLPARQRFSTVQATEDGRMGRDGQRWGRDNGEKESSEVDFNENLQGEAHSAEREEVAT